MINKMKDSLNIAIAGATGYVGLELIKILSKHPKVKILYLCANKSTGSKIDNYDKKIIKKNKLTTRDSRAVERKKYGHRKARRSFQFSKR